MSNKELVSEWFYQYHQDVYQFLVYYTGRLDTEDLVQEVFIKAMKGASRFNGRSSVKTWLFSIARSVAIDQIRKEKRRPFHFAVPWQNTYDLGHEQTPEQIVKGDESKQELYHAIHRLKRNYRDVIILRAIQELSVAETALTLGWSNQKVRTTYSRALKALGKLQGGLFDG
ncbi:RNA polymerase sigma factor [Gracilibacillus sp. YIM 98692]|uniref:RNA polymerase sigma factor n=1 Tax=Gracilibacillus sp. YIM 98692 TaxID=2663532 RepID=UPI0013D5D01A|nr:RNA polymerase sigma factor [Gracilibacillus sp. YIM 98692]